MRNVLQFCFTNTLYILVNHAKHITHDYGLCPKYFLNYLSVSHSVWKCEKKNINEKLSDALSLVMNVILLGDP